MQNAALSTRSQQQAIEKVERMVREAEKNGREVEFNELFEIPEGLELQHVAWYFNKLASKREEIYVKYFEHYKYYYQWYKLYQLSIPTDATRKLAFSRIEEVVDSVEDLHNLYNADIDDQDIRGMVLKKMKILAKPEFNEWKGIYDEAPYGSRLKALAMKQCLKYATLFEDWEAIYERSSLGSKHQMYAVTRMWEFNKSMKADEEKVKSFKLGEVTRHTIQERMDNESFDSINHDFLLMNYYLQVDKEKSDLDEKKENEKEG